MKAIQLAVRIIFSILLLWQVWTHSHWSVALSITLIMITIEVFARYSRFVIKEVEDLFNKGDQI